MENAISAVEDALAAARSQVPAARLELETQDPRIRAVAVNAGLQGEPPSILDRDAIERVFNRLVDIAEGLPSGLPAPQPLEWAATLVILREMMHHWAIDSVSVR